MNPEEENNKSYHYDLTLLNHFQSSDAIWHHTFNSVLHMLQFLGLERVNNPSCSSYATIFWDWKGLTTPSSPKKL
jgi:hypothetical protein